MEPEFWLARWRDERIGFHRDTVNPHLERHWPALGVRPERRVFVPLCGKSRDLAWLAARGHPVTGIEISPLAVEAFFAESGLRPTLDGSGCMPRWHAGGIEVLCGDFFDLLPEDLAGVGAVYDRAALIALPAGMRRKYAGQLLRLMPPGCRMLLVTLEYPQDAIQGPPFSVSAEEVASLFGAACSLEEVAREDVLEAHARFRERGLERLEEVVWRLERHSG